MSQARLYLSLIPQGLIASMLEPEAFGSYYSVGTKVHSRGEAIFFEVDPAAIARLVEAYRLRENILRNMNIVMDQ